MTERRGTKALETWCRRVTQGYPGVKVENMTTSWRDGLAFCALIHHFRPDLIDFARLDKEDVYGNNELAFRIAERHLGIPALLDAEDMAEYPVPDRLSILTYLSQFYQAFASNSASPIKKSATDSPDGSLVLVQGNVQQSPKMEVGGAGVGVGREPCVVCREAVFLAERLRVEGRLYHRVCFKCARCTSQLNPSDCYEAESGGYVCETCPDEMWEPPEPPPLPRAPPPSGDSGQLPGDFGDLPEDIGHQPGDNADLPTSPGSRQSLVTMRRLFFDTDDAKLLKHDPHHQFVHSTSSLVSNKIKDLSSSVNNNDSSFTKTNNVEKINDTDYVNNDDFVKSTTVKTSFYDSGKNSNFIVDNARTKKEKEEEKEANTVNKSSFNVDPDDVILEKSTLPPIDSDAFLNKKEDNSNLNDAPSIVTEAVNIEVKETNASIFPRKETNNELDDDPSIVTEAVNIEVKETNASIVHEEENCNNSKDGPSIVIEAVNTEVKEDVSKNDKDSSKLNDPPSIVVEGDVAKPENAQKTPVPIPRSPNKKKKIQLDAHVQKSSSLVAPLASLAEAVNSEVVHPEPAPRQTAHVATKAPFGDKPPVGRTKSVEYPDDLNPFDSDDDESAPQSLEDSGVHQEQPIAVSTNPFGSDSEEEDEETENWVEKKVDVDSGGAGPRRIYPVLRPGMSHTLKPTSSTNPFDSDDDEEDKADEAAGPVPSPRKSVQSSPEPTPFPRRSVLRSSDRSITSQSSVGSSTSTPRKKRPAPLPPTGIAATSSPSSSSHHSTPSRFHMLSPPSLRSSCSSLSSVRSRKTRRAPLPPTKPQFHLKTENETKDDSKLADDTSSTTNVVEPLSIIDVPAQDPEDVPLENSVALEISKIDDDIKKLIIEDTKITEVIDSEKKEEEVKMIGEKPCEEVTSEQLETQKTISEIKENVPEKTDSLENTEIDVTENKTENVENTLEPNEIFEEKRIAEWIDDAEKIKASNIIDKLENLKAEKEIQYETEKNTVCVIDERKNIVNRKDDNAGDEFGNKADVDLIGMKSGGRKSSVETEVLIHQSTPVKKWSSSWSCGDRGLDPLLGEDCPQSQESSFLSSPSASCADTSTYQELETTSPSPFEKRYKDSQNMHRKISDSGSLNPHKSTYGQWKRKKAPAPPAPNAQRRPVKPMPIHSIKQELDDIEIKQQGLERQGVSLEQKIREKFDTETSISPYIEELVLQLFELVNEKNELFRKQAELMYLRRQHNLEEEHAELEYQIRCLMSRPEANKTDSDKEMEEKLIQRLVEVVERRDAIVQCLEMDRLREAEEDKSINKQLNRFTQALTSEDKVESSQSTLSSSKKHKKKKKDKHPSVMSSNSALNSSKTNLDLDKDFDESEKLSPESKGNGKKKKKWYTLHHKMTKHL